MASMDFADAYTTTTVHGTHLCQGNVVIVRWLQAVRPRPDRRPHTPGSCFAQMIRTSSIKCRPKWLSQNSARRYPNGCGKAKGCSPRRNKIIVLRAPSTEADRKCRSRRISSRSCRTSNASSPQFIAGLSLAHYASSTLPRIHDAPTPRKIKSVNKQRGNGLFQHARPILERPCRRWEFGPGPASQNSSAQGFMICPENSRLMTALQQKTPSNAFVRLIPDYWVQVT